MRQFEREIHYVVVLFLLHHIPQVGQDLNCLVSDELIGIIEQAIEKREDR